MKTQGREPGVLAGEGANHWPVDGPPWLSLSLPRRSPVPVPKGGKVGTEKAPTYQRPGCWNLNTDELDLRAIPLRFIPVWPSSNDGLVPFYKDHELLL